MKALIMHVLITLGNEELAGEGFYPEVSYCVSY
jgi:hypothetical protein